MLSHRNPAFILSMNWIFCVCFNEYSSCVAKDKPV